MKEEFILDADSEAPIDLGSEDALNINPTTDVTHSILEPMKIEPLRLPQNIIDKMKESYDEVCLNDFKDMYHMPEEERQKTFAMYDVFRELRMIKIKHRTLDSYVKAYRIMLKVLDAVAEGNYVYSKEEFIKKVLKGKIKVSGLKIPKYIGRGKKDINWDMVAEYTLDNEKDPSELMKHKNEAFFDIITEDDIEELESFLGKDIDQYVKDHSTIDEDDLAKINYSEEDLTGSNVLLPMTKKEQRQLFKDNKGLLIGLKDAKKMSKTGKRIYSSYAYDLAQDAFSEIKDRDEETGRLKIPEFKGDAFNKRDVDKYLAVLEEYDREHTKVEINGRYYTMDEADEMALKQLLETNGYDIRKFYSYKEEEKKLIKRKKKEKAKIEKLKKTLRKAKERYEDRESDGKVNGKKKKKSKKRKKYDKELDRKLIPNGGYPDFDEYAKMMESWGDD